MDPTNNEQTQLLREIWNQLKTVDRTLNEKIDALGDRLDARIDETNRELRTFRLWTQENFVRVQRNFDRLVSRDERFEAIDARLVRLERHTGLSD